MSGFDLITDLPLCLPLISDGRGQWKGHRVVLRDLTQNDSTIHLNLIENGVTHRLANTYWGFPLLDCILRTKDKKYSSHNPRSF